jgi:hypothetical protein
VRIDDHKAFTLQLRCIGHVLRRRGGARQGSDEQDGDRQAHASRGPDVTPPHV